MPIVTADSTLISSTATNPVLSPVIGIDDCLMDSSPTFSHVSSYREELIVETAGNGFNVISPA